MNLRKAFTLIELLVVIAIIAILAAILFPVFAQAKQAAKGAASISNNKQITLATIMYAGDFDDRNPLDVAWRTGSDPVQSFGATNTAWPRLIKPYEKNDDLNSDPLTTPTAPQAGWPTDLLRQYWPQYGMNNTVLSPTNYNDGINFTKTPRTQTALGDPASTVAYASKYSNAEYNNGAGFPWNSAGYGYGSTGQGSFYSAIMVNVPVCDLTTFYKNMCMYTWHWGTGSPISTMLSNLPVAGAITGGASLRAANNSVVSFADGHTKKLAAGNLAAGTNFNMNLAYTNTVVNDLSKYMWDDL